MLAAFDQLRDGTRAVVLTGTGTSLCAGIGLKEIEAYRVQRCCGISGPM